MNSFRILDRRWVSVAAVFALLIASIIPALAFAAQVTERSIALSNSSADMDNVTYQVNFTAPAAAGAFVVEFCSNSPLIGSSCTAPAGMLTTAAASVSSGITAVDGTDAANKILVTTAITAGEAVTADITGINNPTAAGPLYARIVTYTTATAAGDYPTNLADNAVVRDQGGVAISITPTVGVSGAVQESLSFCVAKNEIAKNCDLDANDDGTNDNPAPTLRLGQDVGGTLALEAGVVSEGTIWTQLSTNAVSGAIVSLKSATACGGMNRLNVPTCDIAPAVTGGVTANGAAQFGVKTSAPTDGTGTGTANGTLRTIGSYSTSAYYLGYTQGSLTNGVTSTYGDQFIDSDGAPVNNKNMQLTFAATVTNQTPAGLYSTDLSMIATGKF
ncbi:hypothetical protein HY312_02535 [Candidatus Saccharibacteria bacterium]|nr:hypothetical protein [Candidatus Saccharibacteria bacterium]